MILRRVEPISWRHEESTVDGHPCIVHAPAYPPPPLGDELRERRKLSGIGLRAAARRAGIRPSDWTALETGAMVPHDERDWTEVLFAALARHGRCGG